LRVWNIASRRPSHSRHSRRGETHTEGRTGHHGRHISRVSTVSVHLRERRRRAHEHEWGWGRYTVLWYLFFKLGNSLHEIGRMFSSLVQMIGELSFQSRVFDNKVRVLTSASRLRILSLDRVLCLSALNSVRICSSFCLASSSASLAILPLANEAPSSPLNRSMTTSIRSICASYSSGEALTGLCISSESCRVCRRRGSPGDSTGVR